ncbi:FtsW/RodA/SpoVE family cell cycle protein [Holdemania filiformis]|uniref:FtsW/RodA/SpoVE family cell cycle protein n=1 Tax=Holdemania filiformis TaxID=61171 RepID=UPI0026768EE6|nr:FtsW/RodA/SpoVE family cell cycle protein [Holdemania filiformis]
MNLTQKKKTSFRMPYRYDLIIHLCTLILAVFGLFMVASATMGLASGNVMSLMKTIIKQLAFTVLGYLGMVTMARWFTFDRMKKNITPIVSLTLVLLLFALCWEVGGARAWIKIPFPGQEITIQPSEFSKVVIIMVMATYLGDIRNLKLTTKDLMRNPLLIVGGFCFIVAILQSDFGSAIVMAGIACICFLIPYHPSLVRLQKMLVMLLIIGVVLIVWILSPMGEHLIEALPFKNYQINRFTSAMNPFADKYGTGFQLINGLVSFASGGWQGVGYGKSIQKYTNFPAANTDFILAIVVEELGIFGFLLIFICYALIVGRMFIYAIRMKSQRGRIVLIGVSMYFFIHFLFNVGGVTGLIPLTGVPLLMISAGGSSTLSVMVAVGMGQAVISQYRQGKIE